MIRIEEMQLRRLAAQTLQEMNVADTVQMIDLHELEDGTWLLGFIDRLPATRFPGFEIYIQQEWSADQVVKELRLEFRKRLWICPLCERRAEIRRLVDRDVFRVLCDDCGRYEIEADLLEHLRQIADDEDQAVAARVRRLAAHIRRGGDLPTLSKDNWVGLAE